MPFEVPSNMHSVVETVDSAFEYSYPGWRKLIPPFACTHSDAVFSDLRISATSLHLRHEERRRVRDGLRLGRYLWSEQALLLYIRGSNNIDAIITSNTNTAIALLDQRAVTFCINKNTTAGNIQRGLAMNPER